MEPPRCRKIDGKIYIKDQRDISESEFKESINTCNKIQKIIDNRHDYIRKLNLDNNIVLPDRTWKVTDNSELTRAYRFVVKAEYKVINRLRFFIQHFTGFQLLSFSWSAQKEHVKNVPEDYDKTLDKILRKPDRFVKDFVDITRYIPDWLVARPPKILGEVGWSVDGSPVNYDVYACQERLNLMYESGIINWLKHKEAVNDNIVILEIGSGYGALACYLKKVFPKAQFYLVDIPESLLFSSLYLPIVHNDYKHKIYDNIGELLVPDNNFDFIYVPNFLFDNLVESGLKIDLAINTLSFAEMSEAQVDNYARGLKRMLGGWGVCFEQNYEVAASEMTCNCKEILNRQFFRQKIRLEKLVTLKTLTSGIPDIWANCEVSKIIDESFKPFNEKDWRRYLRVKFLKTIFNPITWGRWCEMKIMKIIR